MEPRPSGRPIRPARLLTRADRVLEAITHEVDVQRPAIDAIAGLASLAVTVRFDRDGRISRRPFTRFEAEGDIPSEREG